MKERKPKPPRQWVYTFKPQFAPKVADGAQIRTEVLWLNPAAARALHAQSPQLALTDHEEVAA